MSIQVDLKSRLKQSMLDRDAKTTSVIRMIMSKITEKRTSKGFKGEVTDPIVEEVIAAYKKSLEKGRTEYDASSVKGAEAVAELDFEIKFCAQFLPEQLGEDEVREAVNKAVLDIGNDPKMAGRITGFVMKAHKGKVDAALVKKLVTEALAG